MNEIYRQLRIDAMHNLLCSFSVADSESDSSEEELFRKSVKPKVLMVHQWEVVV